MKGLLNRKTRVILVPFPEEQGVDAWTRQAIDYVAGARTLEESKDRARNVLARMGWAARDCGYEFAARECPRTLCSDTGRGKWRPESKLEAKGQAGTT